MTWIKKGEWGKRKWSWVVVSIPLEESFAGLDGKGKNAEDAEDAEKYGWFWGRVRGSRVAWIVEERMVMVRDVGRLLGSAFLEEKLRQLGSHTRGAAAG